MYTNAVRFFRKVIYKNFPEAEKNENYDPSEKHKDPNHFLWMLFQISYMDNRQKEKAGRWIGYVACGLEGLGVITNDDSRKVLRRGTS
jgi:hypothetical protein